jgi:membrane protein
MAFMASALTFDALLAAVPLFVLIVGGLSYIFGITGREPTFDIVDRFFPQRNGGGPNPFEAIDDFLKKVIAISRALSIYAVPAFLWFSTRLFSSVRMALNQIFEIEVAEVQPHFVISYLLGKLRDFRMVAITVLLFLVNAALTTGLAILTKGGKDLAPALEFFFTNVGRLVGELVAFSFLVSLFLVLYRFAAFRRLSGRALLVASLFTAVMFEVAKRLYGWYLQHRMSQPTQQVYLDVGAFVLFVVWVYYSALVFLLGGVVGRVLDDRDRLQRFQRVEAS